jgi:hypothetical protein
MMAPFLRIVAGTEIAAPMPRNEPAPPPRKKARVPYKDREPIEYQDGLPVIDPAGEADKIFLRIAKHREAAAQFDRCVDIVNDAEGKVSEAEYSHLQNNASNAGELMMLHARGLILCRPTTRRGLIHQVRYLAAQFTDPEACASGGWALPDTIGEDETPWQLVFLRSLAAGLRKMAGEFPEQEGA